MPILDEQKRKDEGEDFGPAYAKPPRDVQRAAVDKTFSQMVQDARSLEGSVFSTPVDWALRTGAGDPMGGLSPQGMAGGFGVVKNPGSALFKRLAVVDPGLAKALQRMRPTTEWLDTKVASDFSKGTHGVTTGMPPAKLDAIGKEIAAGAQSTKPLRLSNEELARLHQYSTTQPGSTLQAIKPGENDTTLVHEALHALYGGTKNPLRMQPELSPGRARELMMRALNRSGLSLEDQFRVYEQYYADPNAAHGLIDAIAAFKANKAAEKLGLNVKK